MDICIVLDLTYWAPPEFILGHRGGSALAVKYIKAEVEPRLYFNTHISDIMYLLSTLALAALVAVAQAQSLTVANNCGQSVFLYTQNSFGTILNDQTVAAGASLNMGISSNWDGAINVGKVLVFLANA